MYTLLELESKTFGELKTIGYELNVLPEGDRRRRQSWIDAIAGVNPPLLQLLEVSPGVAVDRAQEPVIETVESSPAAEAEQVQELPIESKFGRIVYPRPAQEAIVQTIENSPGVEVEPVQELLPDCVVCFGDGYIEDEFGRVKFCQCEPKLSHQKSQSAIVPATKNLPGSRSKASTAHQLLELFKSSAHILEDFPGVKTDETAIAPVAKNYIEEESDPNPILTGMALSDRFVARYPPPRAEIIHFQSDADGQLSLLDFEVEPVNEPPDPDDFESLDAFREAISRWDREHPSSFDHCSDHLPNSVHCEPPSPEDFDSMFAFWAAYDAWDEASNDDPEPLETSLDSFCEWAPCPADWYEPVALDGSSKVLEMSPGSKSSITSDFFILTFDRWGDRSNGSDEPPDTWIFARLPKPKPPKFPPQAASQPPVHQVSRNYPEAIPKLFHRVVAGSVLSARSPPGGDAIAR